MRRFECIGGGSEKFWEIDRAGASVTVHFGRIGTAGQTQVKELGTEQAATAHVAKLIAEKVRKGYVEGGTTPAPAVTAPAAAMASDEDTWRVPPAWWRQVQPFRGRSPAAARGPDPEALETAAELEQRRAVIGPVLLHPDSDPELVRVARLYLDPRGEEPTPLGATVVATIVAVLIDWYQREDVRTLADRWVCEHGVGFAAEAAAWLGRFSLHGRSGAQPGSVELFIGPAASWGAGSVEYIQHRTRALLAGAGDDDYTAARARLAALRAGPLAVRVATSYLLPTEQQWVEDDLATTLATGPRALLTMLLPSVTAEPQATAILDAVGPWPVVHAGALYSMAAYIGPDVAPVLMRVFDADVDAASKKRVASMVGEFPTDEAFQLLLDRLDQRYVQPVVLDAMKRFPRRAMRLLAEAATGAGPRAQTARDLLRGHALAQPDIVAAARDALAPAAASVLDDVREATAAVPEAPAGSVPDLLVTPPWTERRSRPPALVVPGIGRTSPITLRWASGERDTWAQTDIGYGGMLAWVGDWDGTVRRAASGQDWHQVVVFALAPEELVRPHLFRAQSAHNYDVGPALQRILGRFGEDAAAYVLRVVLSKPTTLAAVLLPFEGSDITARMAGWYARSKAVRPVAVRWFDRHAPAAAADLVPVALGKPGKDRSDAEDALQLLAQRGHGDAVRAAAGAYGPAAVEGVEATLARDPLQLLPARVPALPAWLDPAHLPAVLLRDRRAALPASAVGHLCTMLAMSTIHDVYAGVELVQEAVDPRSLAETAWGIFERWQGAGYPAKDGWVLDALAVLGDDGTVRRLAPLIRAWPGEGAHKRAVTGLEVLSAIGTDVALMHLHGIAEKAKFAGLRTAARAKMDEVAEGLGLSAEQLADRLVPDFGLDGDGSMVLDYGPRRFRVGFDEQLKPVVADEDGSRRKLLPKPAAKDDPVQAPAAYARFTGLKKDVKTIAADQIRRFERAMVNSRRWTAAEQRALFVDHPLLRHLSRRLVWATFDGDDRPTGSFRFAEDQTLADPDDDELTVAADTVVGIAHPLHLGETLGTWSDVFADYEILQPFPQLAREVLALTADERAGRRLPRFAGATVYTGKILGLSHRGWQRGSPQDNGVSHVTYKLVPGGRAVVVDLDPGIVAGEAMEFPEQTIAGVWLNDGPADWGHAQGNLPFSVLDDITASEMLRDLEGLLS